MASVAHHPAVFFTQSGTFSANVIGTKIVPDNTNVAHTSKIVILFFNYIVKLTKRSNIKASYHNNDIHEKIFYY